MSTEMRSTSVPFDLKILSTLSFLTTGSYQRIIGNDFSLYMSQPSVSRYLKLLIDGLNYMSDYIKFPSTTNERDRIKQGVLAILKQNKNQIKYCRFYIKFGVPGVIGYVDGMHIAIIPPRNHPSEPTFFYRKGYHSINATIICDSDLKIIGVCAKFGGASHDSHVWCTMAISTYVLELYNIEQGWLLGDLEYYQRPWLMTPFQEPIQPGTPEAYYNKKHNMQLC